MISSGQQNRCPIPLKRYEIPGVQRKQMRHKTEIICILHVGHLVWRSQWPLHIRQLGDILMDCTMYLYIFQVLWAYTCIHRHVWPSLRTDKILTRIKISFCEIDRCIRIASKIMNLENNHGGLLFQFIEIHCGSVTVKFLCSLS